MDVKDAFIPGNNRTNIQLQNILIKDIFMYTRARIK